MMDEMIEDITGSKSESIAFTLNKYGLVEYASWLDLLEEMQRAIIFFQKIPQQTPWAAYIRQEAIILQKDIAILQHNMRNTQQDQLHYFFESASYFQMFMFITAISDYIEDSTLFLDFCDSIEHIQTHDELYTYLSEYQKKIIIPFPTEEDDLEKDHDALDKLALKAAQWKERDQKSWINPKLVNIFITSVEDQIAERKLKFDAFKEQCDILIVQLRQWQVAYNILSSIESDPAANDQKTIDHVIEWERALEMSTQLSAPIISNYLDLAIEYGWIYSDRVSAHLTEYWTLSEEAIKICQQVERRLNSYFPILKEFDCIDLYYGYRNWSVQMRYDRYRNYSGTNLHEYIDRNEKSNFLTYAINEDLYSELILPYLPEKSDFFNSLEYHYSISNDLLEQAKFQYDQCLNANHNNPEETLDRYQKWRNTLEILHSAHNTGIHIQWDSLPRIREKFFLILKAHFIDRNTHITELKLKLKNILQHWNSLRPYSGYPTLVLSAVGFVYSGPSLWGRGVLTYGMLETLLWLDFFLLLNPAERVTLQSPYLLDDQYQNITYLIAEVELKNIITAWEELLIDFFPSIRLLSDRSMSLQYPSIEKYNFSDIIFHDDVLTPPLDGMDTLETQLRFIAYVFLLVCKESHSLEELVAIDIQKELEGWIKSHRGLDCVRTTKSEDELSDLDLECMKPVEYFSADRRVPEKIQHIMSTMVNCGAISRIKNVAYLCETLFSLILVSPYHQYLFVEEWKKTLNNVVNLSSGLQFVNSLRNSCNIAISIMRDVFAKINFVWRSDTDYIKKESIQAYSNVIKNINKAYKPENQKCPHPTELRYEAQHLLFSKEQFIDAHPSKDNLHKDALVYHIKNNI